MSDWAEQWNLEDDETVENECKTYQSLMQQSKIVYVSRVGTANIPAKRKSTMDKKGTVFFIKKTTKRSKESNKGKPMKYHAQNEFVENFVKNHWNSGDLATQREVYAEHRAKPFCQPGH